MYGRRVYLLNPLRPFCPFRFLDRINAGGSWMTGDDGSYALGRLFAPGPEEGCFYDEATGFRSVLVFRR